MSNFYSVINEAIADIEANGFDSKERIDRWMQRIDQAVRNQMMPAAQMDEVMRRTMHDIYSRMVDKGQILKQHKGVTFFKLEHVKPKLRAELDRRIMASANLIKLNREQAIAKTLQRFSGWSTSIPAGGSDAVDTGDVKASMKKALKSLPFEERRVLIDQGHKFTASLNNILAVDGGAIGVRWHSHFRQPGYNYRVDHKERDGKVYLIRDSWAHKTGLVKPGPNGYYDQITAVGEEVFCRCNAVYVYSLRGMPDDMLTNMGRATLSARLASPAAAQS